MRVAVDPQRVQITGHQPFTITATITNTNSVIGGYHLRVLGADPAWVTLEAENISLFPDSSQSVAITVAIPDGVGAGDRRIAVQVRELTPPQAVSVTEIELVVPAREAMRMTLSPMTVVCGKTGRFSVLAENTGNTPVSAVPVGMDPEDKISFEFLPAVLDLAPGDHIIADLRAKARRRWFGSPVVRPFGLAAVDAEPPGPPAPPAEAGAVTVPEPPPEPPEPLAQGTMMQKPRLGRGALSLSSLLLAVTVFAVVITIAMSRLAGASQADRDLALQIATARQAGGGTGGSSALGGTAKQLTDGSPATGVAVELFASGDLTKPIISTATNKSGVWAVTDLPAGSYKVRFRGAGFSEIWYPSALDGASAKEIQLDAGQKVRNLDVTLGGLPASISGQVMGADVAGAILTVQVPQQYLAPVRAAPSGSAAGSTPTAPATATGSVDPPGLRGAGPLLAPAGNAAPTGSAENDPPDAPSPPSSTAASGLPPPGGVLRTVPLSSDGMFTLADLPSPAVYDLVVSKTGYATDTQRVDLAGGESRSGVTMMLRTGDGLISGTVVGPDGPLGNAVITASSGSDTVKTLSLTKGHPGTFTLRGLITPATYTVTVTLAGYTTVTSTLSLASGQKLTSVLLSLSKAAGSLSGVVTTLSDGAPAPGVQVTISSGTVHKLSTVTQSGDDAGTWQVAGLPIPGTYTVTFSRSDLQAQTVAVALNSAGQLTSGAGASGGIDVAMRSAFAVVQGTITQQQPGGGTVRVGEATITLTSGTQSYTVTSASVPTSDIGHFRVGHVAPGTYTLSASRQGTSPTTVIITATAGQALTRDIVLIPPASIRGAVTRSGDPLPGTEVDLYLAGQYPAKIYRSTTTARDGHYTFADVDAPQAYVVEARNAISGPLGSGTIVLSASQAGVLDLEVGAAATTSSAAPSTSAAGLDSSPGTASATGTGSSPSTTASTTTTVTGTSEGAAGTAPTESTSGSTRAGTPGAQETSSTPTGTSTSPAVRANPPAGDSAGSDSDGGTG